jgi:hypothetical protein
VSGRGWESRLVIDELLNGVCGFIVKHEQRAGAIHTLPVGGAMSMATRTSAAHVWTSRTALPPSSYDSPRSRSQRFGNRQSISAAVRYKRTSCER